MASSNVTITSLYGGMPLQGEGTLADGRHFYFRARYEMWQMLVGATAEEALSEPTWGWSEPWGDTPFAASYMPGAAAYAASKAGVSALARVLASELAPRGIRVNTVVPGATLTPILSRGTTKTPEEAGEAIRPRIPLARLCTPEEVASAIIYLTCRVRHHRGRDRRRRRNRGRALGSAGLRASLNGGRKSTMRFDVTEARDVVTMEVTWLDAPLAPPVSLVVTELLFCVVFARIGTREPVRPMFLLGFDQPSSFYRAFRTWTGTTPESARHGQSALQD